MTQQPETNHIRWTVFGISTGLVERRLAPVLVRTPDLLRVPLDGHPLDTLADDPAWDLLFVGYESPGTGTLESLVRRVAQGRPLQCIVAFAPVLSPARHVELLLAGAVDALDPDQPRERVEQVIDRALALLGARRRELERQKKRLVNQLAVSVNHEINNPLTGIMGTAELMMLKSPELDERTTRDLRTIISQCRRIQDVTGRLKTLNQLRTIPYGDHDTMIDLIGADKQPMFINSPTPPDQFLPVPSLLIIDDNPLMIDLIERLFEQRFQVTAAGCASEALERIERKGYDIVLIDLILPEMNGLELYRAIRRLRPDQKAIMTTAYHDDPRVEQAIVEGALGCVNKPFQLEQLEQAIAEALRERTARHND